MSYSNKEVRVRKTYDKRKFQYHQGLMNENIKSIDI
jgi:hypothetical protein